MQRVTTLRHPLLSYFDTWTIAKGEDYHLRGKVVAFNRGDEGLDAEVTGSGSNRYHCAIRFNKTMSAITSAGCSCPVRRGCKHACAALLRFLDTSDSAIKAESSPSADAKVARVTISPGSRGLAPPVLQKDDAVAMQQFEQGLRRVASLYSGLKPATRPAAPSAASARTRLIYVLNPESWSIYRTVEPTSVSLSKNGRFGASRALNWDSIDYRMPNYAEPEDAQVARIFVELNKTHSWSSGDFEIDRNNFAAALRRVLNTGRCYFQSPVGALLSLGCELPGKLVWDRMPDEKLQIAIKASTPDGKSIRAFRWKFPWYLDEASSQCGPVSLDIHPDVLDKLLLLPQLANDAQASQIPLMLSSFGLEGLLPSPPALNPIRIETFKPPANLTVQRLVCRAPAVTSQDYDYARVGETVRVLGVSTDAAKAAEQTHIDDSGTTIISRPDPGAEKHYADRLRQLGFVENQPMYFENCSNNKRLFAGPDQAWLKLSELLPHLREEGWNISDQAAAGITPIELSDADLEFSVETEDDWWFSLALHIDVNGKRLELLPLLISAIRSLSPGEHITDSIDELQHDGKFVATLPNGQLIVMPFDRIKPILISVQELIWKTNTDKIKLSALHAEELLGHACLSAAKWTGANRLRSLVERLGKLRSIDRTDVPAQFNAELRPYQVDGMSWLQFLGESQFGGILADDMGLGKTVELLAHIALEKQHGRLTAPYLIICPTSVAPNWLSEIAKFAPQLDVVRYTGPDRFLVAERCASADVVVSTYPLIVRDKAMLSKINWRGVALDEAQAIKNPDTQVAQAARSLKAEQRFCLTGTPIENHLGELWSQFQFLLPGLLGERAMFNEFIRKPIEKFGDAHLKAVLAHRIRPFVLRRTKQQVAADLPEKTMIVQPVELADGQRDLYETVRMAALKRVRDEIAHKGFKQSQIMILDALLKLRQACCDPRLVKLTIASKSKKSAKLELLMEMLPQLIDEGRKILVFSQFTSMLDLIAAELDNLELPFVQLRGDTKDRKAPVDQFQKGDVPIFLISLKAGGTGLNLTAADTVIHYDPWWNPAVEDQATDRAHRIGQTKKVFVYKLIAKGTIEERMLDLQERKRALANAIYDDRGNLSLSFTEDDLVALLQPINGILG